MADVLCGFVIPLQQIKMFSFTWPDALFSLLLSSNKLKFFRDFLGKECGKIFKSNPRNIFPCKSVF